MEKTNIELDEAFTSYLDMQKPNTRSVYSTYFKLWIEFSGMNGKESIAFKKADRDNKTEAKVLEFRQWMQKKGLSENSSKTACAAIRGFYASKRLPLVFIRNESRKLTEANRATQDYLFSKEDLYRMSQQGDLEERYILLVGASVGLRASDFLTFTYGQFRSLNFDAEAPIPLGEIATIKEKVRAYPFLSSDAVQVIKLILERNTDKKNTDKVLNFADEQPLGLALKRMFDAAHLVSGNKIVRFHNLRKYLIDRLSAVASESQWKQIVGKKIAEGAYVSQDQLKDVYARAMPSINVNGNSKASVKIDELEKMIEQLRAEIEMEKQNSKQLVIANAANASAVQTLQQEFDKYKKKHP
jgi:hypothetical protein